MVDRVTTQMMQSSALSNIFRLSEDLSKTQNQISLGKKISVPSDDPAGARDSLQLHATIGQVNQFIRNINFNTLSLQSGDSALSTVGSALTQAKQLAISQLNGVSTGQIRGFTGSAVAQLVTQVLQSANSKVNGKYIFAGTNTLTPPFSASASGAVYTGNSESLQIEVASGYKVSVGLPGSQVLGTDLNPTLTSSTLLSSLNGGAGVPGGSFTITSRGGSSSTFSVTPGMTLGQLMSNINNSGLNVTASINSQQNGIVLTDTSPTVKQALSVAEAGGGTTATALGIKGRRDGVLVGTDVNPAITASTQLSQLNGGAGVSLTSVDIVNGSASAAVTLSSAKTVGDVLNLINNAGLNVTASINSQSNALSVTSNNSSTVAVVSEVGTGTSAQDLGIGGGRNVLLSLISLRNALNKNDQQGVLAVLGNLDRGLNMVNNGRAVIGAVQNQVNNILSNNNQDVVNLTAQVSSIEDTDLVSAGSHLAQLQTAFQATLSTTALIEQQPNLQNFLK